jgi:hypothetical protein
MSLYVDEQLVAAVAAALGETIDLVRHRGFHLEHPTVRGALQPARSQHQGHDDPDDDTLDMAACGVDWDAHDDSRLRSRPRRMTARRRHPRAA